MFRFTIRDVLWLMVVVAMGVAWWMDHSRIQSQLVRSEGQLGDLSRAVWEAGYDPRPKDGPRLVPLPPPKVGFHPEWTGNGYTNVPNAPKSSTDKK